MGKGEKRSPEYLKGYNSGFMAGCNSKSIKAKWILKKGDCYCSNCGTKNEQAHEEYCCKCGALMSEEADLNEDN